MRAAGSWAVLALCLQLSGCACWAWAHGDTRSEVGIEIINETDETICGVYIWHTGDEGGTGIVASSPELNNVLARGSYMVADEHPKALHPGARRFFGMRVTAADRFNIRARNCEEEIIFKRDEVCLAKGLTLRL